MLSRMSCGGHGLALHLLLSNKMGREKIVPASQKYCLAGWRTAALVKVNLKAICSLRLHTPDLGYCWAIAPLKHSMLTAFAPHPPSTLVLPELRGHPLPLLCRHLPSSTTLSIGLIFLFPVHSHSPVGYFLRVAVPSLFSEFLSPGLLHPQLSAPSTQWGWDHCLQKHTVRVRVGSHCSRARLCVQFVWKELNQLNDIKGLH